MADKNDLGLGRLRLFVLNGQPFHHDDSKAVCKSLGVTLLEDAAMDVKRVWIVLWYKKTTRNHHDPKQKLRRFIDAYGTS